MATEAQEIFDTLRRLANDVVPVIGAGMAAGCGAPTARDLTAALARAGAIAPSENANLFAIADQLGEVRGPAWVQEVVAAIVRETPLAPTLGMQALTLVPTRLVLTTNYDLAVEE